MARFSIPLVLTWRASCAAVGTPGSRVLLPACPLHTKVWQTVFICMDICHCQLTVSSSAAPWKVVFPNFRICMPFVKRGESHYPALPHHLNISDTAADLKLSPKTLWPHSFVATKNPHWLRCMMCLSHEKLNIHHLFVILISLWQKEFSSVSC
jgi:hypothetical protein